MSKASAWAAQVQAMRDATPENFIDPRTKTGLPGPYIRADVGTDNTMAVKVNEMWAASLPPEIALALARWILDTFGETPEA